MMRTSFELSNQFAISRKQFFDISKCGRFFYALNQTYLVVIDLWLEIQREFILSDALNFTKWNWNYFKMINEECMFHCEITIRESDVFPGNRYSVKNVQIYKLDFDKNEIKLTDSHEYSTPNEELLHNYNTPKYDPIKPYVYDGNDGIFRINIINAINNRQNIQLYCIDNLRTPLKTISDLSRYNRVDVLKNQKFYSVSSWSNTHIQLNIVDTTNEEIFLPIRAEHIQYWTYDWCSSFLKIDTEKNVLFAYCIKESACNIAVVNLNTRKASQIIFNAQFNSIRLHCINENGNLIINHFQSGSPWTTKRTVEWTQLTLGRESLAKLCFFTLRRHYPNIANAKFNPITCVFPRRFEKNEQSLLRSTLKHARSFYWNLSIIDKLNMLAGVLNLISFIVHLIMHFSNSSSVPPLILSGIGFFVSVFPLYLGHTKYADTQ